MNKFKTIEYYTESNISHIVLNRPDVRNAFNGVMIEELHKVIEDISQSYQLKALVISGNGPVFSAGADLNWMKKMVDYSYNENYDDSLKLHELYDKLYAVPIPTISLVHGASIGGANGLLGASDIVLAETQTQFRFSEVKLGLIPATIASYIIKRIGEHAAKYYMLTGKTFGSSDALRIGLVNSVGSQESIETELQIIINELNNNSLDAVKKTKELINIISGNEHFEDIKKKAVETIAEARISKDGQEGMKAFLEKRKPKWIKEQ